MRAPTLAKKVFEQFEQIRKKLKKFLEKILVPLEGAAQDGTFPCLYD
jgi:hypothetical protein